uniref:Uncharacterized protein n=1 Tax=Timema douglasi TaxID=61478 RepID=A0A7R8VNH7_TIMDO|nr:unnamed protein product [Timema douglasi]
MGHLFARGFGTRLSVRVASCVRRRPNFRKEVADILFVPDARTCSDEGGCDDGVSRCVARAMLFLCVWDVKNLTASGQIGPSPVSSVSRNTAGSEQTIKQFQLDNYRPKEEAVRWLAKAHRGRSVEAFITLHPGGWGRNYVTGAGTAIATVLSLPSSPASSPLPSYVRMRTTVKHHVTSTMKRTEQRSLKAGEITQQESQNMSAASMKLQTETFSAEKKAMAAQQQRQTVTSTGIFNQEKHMAASSQSNFTITAKGVCTKSSLISSQSQLLVQCASTWTIRERRGQSMFATETDGNTDERTHAVSTTVSLSHHSQD